MKKSFSLLLFLLLVFSFPFARGKDIICVICETTTSLAEEYIAIEGLNETEVLNQLDKFCNILPASWQTTCIFFLNTYGRQIVDELIDGTPAEKICSQFSLCDSVKKMTATKLRSNVSCPLCELLTVIIEEYIDESGFNETQILKDLAEFCGYLPKDVRPKCSILVESAASKLVHELVKGTDPSIVCSNINLCRASIYGDLLERNLFPKALKAHKEKQCLTCLWYGTLFGQEMKPNFEDLNTRIIGICKSFHAKCNEFLRYHATSVFQYLQEGKDKYSACVSAEVCSKHDEKHKNRHNNDD